MEALIWLFLYYAGASFHETYSKLYIFTVSTIFPPPKEGELADGQKSEQCNFIYCILWKTGDSAT